MVVGSTIQDGEKTLKVLGEYEDGAFLVSSMDSKRLGSLKRAVTKINRTLGNKSLVEAAQVLSSYDGLVVGVGDRAGEDLKEVDNNLVKLGLGNLVLHSASTEDLPEDLFVGPRITAENGVMYRIKCPFEGVSRTWQRIARTTRR